MKLVYRLLIQLCLNSVTPLLLQQSFMLDISPPLMRGYLNKKKITRPALSPDGFSIHDIGKQVPPADVFVKWHPYTVTFISDDCYRV